MTATITGSVDTSSYPTPAVSVARMFYDRVRATPDAEAFRFPAQGAWASVTWAETAEIVKTIAAGLLALGIRPEERVAIASATRVEWLYADLAIMCAGARHLRALDPATEVPPEDVLSRRYRRVQPYLYCAEEIGALMRAADRRAPAMRAATWRTLIGLLAVTGMRQGEACRLGRGDVDLETGMLVIADSKFGKSRQVFVHPAAAAALRAYEQFRDEAFPEPQADSFFVNSRGRPLDAGNIQHTFAAAPARRPDRAAGIRAHQPGPPGCPPRRRAAHPLPRQRAQRPRNPVTIRRPPALALHPALDIRSKRTDDPDGHRPGAHNRLGQDGHLATTERPAGALSILSARGSTCSFCGGRT